MPSAGAYCNQVAVSHDGTTLLVLGGSHDIHVFSVRTGEFLRAIGSYGTGPLHFKHPAGVWVASDGFVFVADCYNHRIQILTPRYDFYAFVGYLCFPTNVCANQDTFVVAEVGMGRLSVFKRDDNTLIKRFGSAGFGDGQLSVINGLCFYRDRHVAVADYDNSRVSVFTLEGEFVRHVGVGLLVGPISVACSDANELVVADYAVKRIYVFDASGRIVWTSTAGGFTGVATHGSTIFGQTSENKKCHVFT